MNVGMPPLFWSVWRTQPVLILMEALFVIAMMTLREMEGSNAEVSI